MSSEVIPLVYFTHAELKSKENLAANFEYIESAPTTGLKASSLRKSPKRKRHLKLTVKDENMKYEAIEEQDQPFVIGKLNTLIQNKLNS